MTNDPGLNLQRLNDLLAERAALGLSAEEELELAQLVANSTANSAGNSNTDRESFEITAARAALAFHPRPLDPLPEQLRKRIAAAAKEHFARPAIRVEENEVANPRPSAVSRRSRFREVGPWIVAAACLLIAVVSLWRGRSSSAVAPAEERSALLKNAPDVVRVPWTATGDPAAKKVAGDVVWSTADQTGYMRFKDLAANDPAKDEYQLWIFDANQDPRYPIDGGVFDVGPATVDKATGDTIVPIHAKLRVVSPKMFAVTVEKPGGVVVSSRDRVAVLAKIGPSGG